LPPANLPWSVPFETNSETIELAASASTFAPRNAGPPKIDGLPPNKPPNSKFGISNKSDPRNELEKPELPKPEFPKSKPPKPELLKRELPKFDIERPEEKDENDENRDLPGRFVEKASERNSQRGSRAYDAVARVRPNDDHPDAFEAKLPFLEFPNVCHCPSDRALLL
jgi:hypothetical protein